MKPPSLFPQHQLIYHGSDGFEHDINHVLDSLLYILICFWSLCRFGYALEKFGDSGEL